MNKNVKAGFIAIRDNVPVFIYNKNEVVEFTDESRQDAYLHNGKTISARLDLYKPDNVLRAKILEFTTSTGEILTISTHFNNLKNSYTITRAEAESIYYAGCNTVVQKKDPHKLCNEVLNKLLNHQN